MFKKKPWGWYLTLWSQQYFKLKLLYFRPEGEISLQRHAKRNETWLFLFGFGLMQNYLCHSARVFKWRRTGKYEYVPINHWHHFKAEKRTLVLEVQTGICREEDIERA